MFITYRSAKGILISTLIVCLTACAVAHLRDASGRMRQTERDYGERIQQAELRLDTEHERFCQTLDELKRENQLLKDEILILREKLRAAVMTDRPKPMGRRLPL